MSIDTWVLVIWFAVNPQPIILREYHILERCEDVGKDWMTIHSDAKYKCLKVLW